MIHFRSKTELVLWLDEHAPSKAIQRAIWDGTVELLGGFSRIPPSSYPGWILKIVSKRKTVYFIAIICDTDKKCYKCFETQYIPWELWAGTPGRETIYEGDYPEKYEVLKNENM